MGSSILNDDAVEWGSMQAIKGFFDAWGMSDDDTRLAQIIECYAADGTYADPRNPELLSGATAIADYVAQFSANAPGWAAKVVKDDSTAGHVRVTVEFGGNGADGNNVVQYGQYFATYDSTGKIAQLIGFVGTGAPE